MGHFLTFAPVFWTVALLLSQLSRSHRVCASATVALFPFRGKRTDCRAGADCLEGQNSAVAKRTFRNALGCAGRGRARMWRTWAAAETDRLFRVCQKDRS